MKVTGQAGHGLRKDARQNLERIHAAATQLFTQRGLDVPLEEIAKAAGVSIGTLYNRFASREKLIDAVMSEVARAAFADVFDCVRVETTPWRQFATFVEKICALQAATPALNDAVSRRYPEASELAAVCDEAFTRSLQIIDAAQEDDALRRDFTVEDLFVIFWCNSSLVRAAGAGYRDVWRRNTAIILDGLHTGRELGPLPELASPGQIRDALTG